MFSGNSIMAFAGCQGDKAIGIYYVILMAINTDHVEIVRKLTIGNRSFKDIIVIN